MKVLIIALISSNIGWAVAYYALRRDRDLVNRGIQLLYRGW